MLCKITFDSGESQYFSDNYFFENESLFPVIELIYLVVLNGNLDI